MTSFLSWANEMEVQLKSCGGSHPLSSLQCRIAVPIATTKQQIKVFTVICRFMNNKQQSPIGMCIFGDLLDFEPTCRAFGAIDRNGAAERSLGPPDARVEGLRASIVNHWG